jgi:addiction module HigA family antidote
MTKKGRGAAPTHPGEILLEEFLKSYDPPVSQVEAADRMHIPKVRLNQLIRGNRGVTPDTALPRRSHQNVSGILDEPAGPVTSTTFRLSLAARGRR